MTTTGFAGLGVSGIQLDGGDAQAFATLEQSITNKGDAAGGLILKFTVPALEASILAGGSVDPGIFLLGSSVSATFTTFQYLADGRLLTEQTVFDFQLGIRRLAAGTTSVDIDRSPDLTAAAGVGSAFIQGDIAGVKYGEIAGERTLAILEPGERLQILYTLTAAASNELHIDEIGFQALVGDPFAVNGTGGMQVSLAGVPEPSTLVPVGLGIVSICATSRRCHSSLRRIRRSCKSRQLDSRTCIRSA
jgi:hypothetical protein